MTPVNPRKDPVPEMLERELAAKSPDSNLADRGADYAAQLQMLRMYVRDRYGTLDGHGRVIASRPPRRHPVLDRVVLAGLILAWLLMATADTYAPLGLMMLLWAVQGWGLVWLWRQYREHTAPSMLDKPRPAIKPDIPLLVRLLLLPGISRWAGPVLTSKARAIRFYRTDMHRRTLAARQTHAGVTDPRRMSLDIPPRSAWERSMHAWAERHPGECSTTVHLFEGGSHRCRCDSWYWSSLNDPRTIA